MKVKYLLMIILVLLFSCNEDQNHLLDSYNIFYTQENSLNHLNLEIAASNSKLVHNEIINFTSDTILINLKIVGKEGEGSGDVHLYQGQSTTVAAYNFISDTLLIDTLLTDNNTYLPPDKATITFRKFTGTIIFQMEGK